MKNVYFFGCSFTAGDELTDGKWFPWKYTEKHTAESYYRKRISLPFDFNRYQEENKKQAYPELVKQRLGINVVNMAGNGRSQERNVLEAFDIIKNNKADLIYFQISPPNRECIIDHHFIFHDVILSNPTEFSKDYAQEKVKISAIESQTVFDTLEMHLLNAYSRSKNIPLYFLNLGEELEFRETDLKTFNQYSLNFDGLNLLNLRQEINHLQAELGGHYSVIQHNIIAEHICNHLVENFIK